MTAIAPISPAPSNHVQSTVSRIGETAGDALQQAEAFVNVALDLQKQPRHRQDLEDALFLYGKAEELVGEQQAVAKARIQAGRGSALRRMPGAGLDELVLSRESFEEALTVLRHEGGAEEVAEVEMSLGVVLQALAGAKKAPINDAIQAYQRALRVFSKEDYPREFAVIHNNLATAYLSMANFGDQGQVKEALAVQSFREALEVVTIEHDPSEFAMLQNNLGNALQAVRSSHPFENLARAVEAYDEALRVRTPFDTPVEYANTVTNKANALMNLPDGFADDSFDENKQSNPDNLQAAVSLLREAANLFGQHHLRDR
ncbi:MAG: hypothetical protein AAGA56_29365, partial [Myxococcota bacterium]